MSHKSLIRFKCDCCGKEIDVSAYENKKQKSPLTRIEFPSKSYDCEGRSYEKRTSFIDLCDDCFLEYWNYVQDKYEVNDLYEVTVKKKF